jgi:hypothetical protein
VHAHEHKGEHGSHEHVHPAHEAEEHDHVH